MNVRLGVQKIHPANKEMASFLPILLHVNWYESVLNVEVLQCVDYMST